MKEHSVYTMCTMCTTYAMCTLCMLYTIHCVFWAPTCKRRWPWILPKSTKQHVINVDCSHMHPASFHMHQHASICSRSYQKQEISDIP